MPATLLMRWPATPKKVTIAQRGTSGRLGSRVLRQILEEKLMPATDLIISSSNPDRAPAIAKAYGIEGHRGDYTDTASLKSSFAGGDVLFLVSHTDPGIQRVEFHKNAIETARAAGVRTIIYTSMMFGGETGLKSVIGTQQGHIHTANYLAKCGMDYVIVREGLYAQAWGYYTGFQQGVFKKGDTQPLEWVVPNEAAISWVDIDDLAEGNAVILANYGKYIGQTLRFDGVPSNVGERDRQARGTEDRPQGGSSVRVEAASRQVSQGA
ncbi:uncharacterized protein Z519_12466 [Cladophialophora bantiana CBS 173.52]|uniref:NAD(P)-binding domain-containing protein n=1 Tax=Cladophialophora bantiana (strain ATCC 10958 / CBS 173.52 / CDC B-1940 / NIH 8579) TaxID=1442370 RepID=A0A0D2EAA8_CLAB1|nr:uncharacterized protein Z519_12466 [Cladophialophora bantiana CBS 173.52]KIW87001.1 hypothetical protein Z519_12466 [Cladophialophora bantiana CBS 173.52]